jgi:LacI family transcriptional regulator
LAPSRITIYDVARSAGVSISTVSRVLNTPQLVNETTRQTVMDAIRQIGFIPKADARARAMREVGRIGVITPFFTEPAFMQRLRGIARRLHETKYELVIYNVDSPARMYSYLERMTVTRNVDGLVLISLPFNNGAAEQLLATSLEAVLLEFTHPSFSGIEIDNTYGGQLAADYLVNKGHRCIGFLGDVYLTDFPIQATEMRLEGFREKLHWHGLGLQPQYIARAPFIKSDTVEAARRLLELPNRPTALFIAADTQAVWVLHLARQMGLRVPQDLAIIGFDDLDIADHVGLTTIRQPLDESGKVAIELLLSRLEDPNRSQQLVKLPLSIVERDTV